MIARKDIVCYKGLAVSRNGNGRSPLYTRCKWGKIRAGKVLAAPAQRSSFECGPGIHAWRRMRDGLTFNANQVWEAVIPKGTWYNRGHDKYRADKIRLVRNVTKELAHAETGA